MSSRGPHCNNENRALLNFYRHAPLLTSQSDKLSDRLSQPSDPRPNAFW